MSACLMHEEQQPRCKLEILFLTTTGYSLQPATCHLPPSTYSMPSATCYRLHQFTCRTLFCLANQMSACWVHIWIKFEGGSVWEEWGSGAKGAWLQMSVTSVMCRQMWGSKEQLRHDMLKDAWVHFVANALQICIRVYPPACVGVCLSVCVCDCIWPLAVGVIWNA